MVLLPEQEAAPELARYQEMLELPMAQMGTDAK